MNFGRDGFYDPFNTDDAGDTMDFKQALTLVNEEISNFNLENDMTEDTKPAAKKTVAKKVEAKPAAKPAEAPAKKTVTKPAAKAEAKPAKPAAKKEAAKSAGPRGLSIPDGYVGLDKIAKDLKTDPASLRRKLRASDFEKPSIGVWAWKEGSKDLEKVTKFLTPKTA